jgi:hypothetical protein
MRGSAQRIAERYAKLEQLGSEGLETGRVLVEDRGEQRASAHARERQRRARARAAGRDDGIETAVDRVRESRS